MIDSKRAALIGTVCGTGKCSPAAALPVLAAAGIEVCMAPMGFEPLPGTAGKARQNLSDALPAYANQWKKIGCTFDAVAFGFPENEEQADSLSSFLHTFRKENNLFLFGFSRWSDEYSDPWPPETVKLAEQFCSKADLVILPISYAAALLGKRERQGPWNRKTVKELLRGICSFGAKSAAVTGVWFNQELTGAAVYNAEDETVSYAFSHRIGGEWLGTGDLFCAALLAGLLHGMRLNMAMQLAVDFTADCIRSTRESGRKGCFGLKFEACLPKLMNQLGVLNQ